MWLTWPVTTQPWTFGGIFLLFQAFWVAFLQTPQRDWVCDRIGQPQKRKTPKIRKQEKKWQKERKSYILPTILQCFVLFPPILGISRVSLVRERNMRTNFLTPPCRGPGHPGQIPGTSQIPHFKTQGRQTFEGGHELFGHHPCAWKTPHRAVSGPKS